VVYEGEFWVKATGKHEFKISPAKLDKLVEAFGKADYFLLKNFYRTDVTCGPSTITSFWSEGRRKRVVNECTGPQVLERLENKIDRLAGLKPLIGKRS
jgi:hypothetical protein